MPGSIKINTACPAPQKSTPCGVNRIIDANINRTKEGLRVCEEIARFILNSRPLTAEFKRIRHNIDSIIKRLPPNIKLIQERNSLKDIGKNIRANELHRADCRDIFCANIQRLKESIRVLEEFSKLGDRKAALGFKEIRYEIYAIEKKSLKKIESLRNIR